MSIAALRRRARVEATVIGCPGRRTSSGGRRDGGTAFAVAAPGHPAAAARSTRSRSGGDGPRHVLVPLDGASGNRAERRSGPRPPAGPDTEVTTVRVVDAGDHDAVVVAPGERVEIATGRVSTRALSAAADVGADLIVLAWKSRTSGGARDRQ